MDEAPINATCRMPKTTASAAAEVYFRFGRRLRVPVVPTSGYTQVRGELLPGAGEKANVLNIAFGIGLNIAPGIGFSPKRDVLALKNLPCQLREGILVARDSVQWIFASYAAGSGSRPGFVWLDEESANAVKLVDSTSGRPICTPYLPLECRDPTALGAQLPLPCPFEMRCTLLVPDQDPAKAPVTAGDDAEPQVKAVPFSIFGAVLGFDGESLDLVITAAADFWQETLAFAQKRGLSVACSESKLRAFDRSTWRMLATQLVGDYYATLHTLEKKKLAERKARAIEDGDGSVRPAFAPPEFPAI